MKKAPALLGRERYLTKCSEAYSAKTTPSNRPLVGVAVYAALLLPSAAFAQVANFAFITDAQTIAPGAASGQATIQAQASGGTSVNVPQTTCLSLTSTSAQGQFSSSASTWNPVAVLTMNKNTANKNFYYKDSQEGTHTLTVKVSLKPEDESDSCANWPLAEWDIAWTATQNITVGTASAPPVSPSGTATSGSESTGAGANSGDVVVPPPPKVVADGGADRTVVAGADTEFRARAYDEKKNVVDFLRFRWNFGDGTTAQGTVVAHRFEYPGRYVVVLDMPEEKEAMPDQIIVTVELLKLELSIMEDGGVAIENKAGRTLDLSRWIIRSTGRTFVLPDRTLVLAGSSLRLSSRTLGFSGGADLALAYPNGQLAQSISPLPTQASTTPAVISAPVSRAQNVRADKTPVPEDLTAAKTNAAAETEPAPAAHAAGAGAALPSPSRIWWAGALGIAGLAAGSLVFARRFAKKEWDIIEGSDEAL